MNIKGIRFNERYLFVNIKLVYKDAQIISKEVGDNVISVIDGYKLIKYLIIKCTLLTDTDLRDKNGFLPLYRKDSIIRKLRTFKKNASDNTHKDTERKYINIINADIQYIKVHNWKYVEALMTDNGHTEFLNLDFACITTLLGYLSYEIKHPVKHRKIDISDDDLPF